MAPNLSLAFLRNNCQKYKFGGETKSLKVKIKGTKKRKEEKRRKRKERKNKKKNAKKKVNKVES